MSDREIEARLNAYPLIKQRLTELLTFIENASDEVTPAMELQLDKALRLLGRAALQSWAERQNQRTEQVIRARGQVCREGYKKLYWHTSFGIIGIDEPQYRSGTQRIRPFAQSAKVRNRSCSSALERRVLDLGPDRSLSQVVRALADRDQIVLSVSTVRRILQSSPARSLVKIRNVSVP